MFPDNTEQLMRELRRKPLFSGDASGSDVSHDRRKIEHLIPHRAPFLLIDGINGLDLDARTIRGYRRVAGDDPVFAGHFPGHPVYPGVLQVETMGQLGLCMVRLISEREQADVAPPQVRAIRIHHALYIKPVGPDERLTVMAGLIEDTGLTAICAGQIYSGDTLCSCAVQEVCFVD